MVLMTFNQKIKLLKILVHFNYESIKSCLNDIVYDSFIKTDNKWLKGLFDEQHLWVPVYVRDTFSAGMSTIQGGESPS
jgi:hypothetical protein